MDLETHDEPLSPTSKKGKNGNGTHTNGNGNGGTGASTKESAPKAEDVVTKPAEKTVEKPAKKNRGYWIVGGLSALLLAGVGVYALVTANQETTDDAQITADIVPIGTRVSGPITRVLVHENQLVKKGDLLAEIDDADYAAKVKQAEAELATAEAQAASADAQVQVVDATSRGGLSSAKALMSGSSVGVRSADAQVEVARAGVTRAEADVKKSELDLARARELRRAEAIPQERLDNAQVANDTAKASLAQAKAQLAAAEEARSAATARVGEAKGRLDQSAPVDAQIATARANADLEHARVRSAQASLDLAKLQLSYTKVTAPADGIASKLTVHEGQLAAEGQPVVELVPTATYVIANFKETQIGRVRPGQRAEVVIDAFPGRKLEGKVESLAGGTGSSFSLLPADNATGNFVKVVQRVPMRIVWTNPPQDLPLRAGLSAEVTVFVEK